MTFFWMIKFKIYPIHLRNHLCKELPLKLLRYEKFICYRAISFIKQISIAKTLRYDLHVRLYVVHLVLNRIDKNFTLLYDLFIFQVRMWAAGTFTIWSFGVLFDQWFDVFIHVEQSVLKTAVIETFLRYEALWWNVHIIMNDLMCSYMSSNQF